MRSRSFSRGLFLAIELSHRVKSGPGIRQEAGTATHACEGKDECGGQAEIKVKSAEQGTWTSGQVGIGEAHSGCESPVPRQRKPEARAPAKNLAFLPPAPERIRISGWRRASFTKLENLIFNQRV
jgi:hypothetical protein